MFDFFRYLILTTSRRFNLEGIMADITLHKDDHTTTTVDNLFIDQYMTDANGEFVKIYLYLLRCMNSPDCCFSISRTADKFNHTEKDIQRALKYWEKMNLLQLEYAQDDSISGIYFLETQAAARDDDSVPLKKTSAPARKSSYTAGELKAFREKEEVQELMFVAESYLARPLTSTDIQKLLFWYDGLSFSVDLIVYLMEYCIAGGHSSLHYMDKVALNWKDEQIKTVEQAKRSSQTHSKLHYAVLKALGIQKRSLVPAELSFINKWNREYGFGQDIITEACNRTILAIHQPSFEYTDRILTSWKRQNVRTSADIHKADEAYQAAKAAERTRTVTSRSITGKSLAANRFNSFPQRTYNMEQLEAKLLNTTG